MLSLRGLYIETADSVANRKGQRTNGAISQITVDEYSWMKVDLMIIGAQKCATSTLFSILDTHPQLRGSRIKETNFFSFDPDWQSNVDKYHASFDQSPGVLYFEASPSYTFPSIEDLASTTTIRKETIVQKEGSFRVIPNARIWEDIYRYNPQLKLIYLVRNPVDRIVSGYMHYYARGYTDLGIEEELATNQLHLEASRYATRIQPFINRFGRDHVLIITFDDLLGARVRTLQQVSAFIGIDPAPFNNVEAIHENATVGQPKLPVKWDAPNIFWVAMRKFAPRLWRKYAAKDERVFVERASLSKKARSNLLLRLEDEISAMEQLLGQDLNSWRS